MGFPVPPPDFNRGHQYTIIVDWVGTGQDRFIASEYSFHEGFLNIWFRNDEGQIANIDVVVLRNALSVNIEPIVQ